MDTSVTYTDFISNNIQNQRTSTEIKSRSNVLKVGVVALGLALSSNQMQTNSIQITSSTLLLSCIDGSFSTNGVYSNRSRYNYAERYRIIAQSEWFKKAYKNKSIGEIIGIEA
jgi:hypothetical protein